LVGFWRAETGIFLVVWLALLAADPTRFFHDPGTFWHVAVGQRILERGEFLRTDPFSFTRGGEPWVAWQWVGEFTMAVLHALGVFDALLLGAVTVVAGLFTWLAHRLMAAGFHWTPAAVLALAGLAVSANHFHVRPHLGTMILFGVTFAMLIDAESGRVGVRRLWWLVPLFVLWANVHGGYLGGLGTLGLTVAGWTLCWLLKWPGPIDRPRTFVMLALIVVASALAALVNPFGWELPKIWISVMFGMDLPSYIQEHARLDPSHIDGQVVLLAGGVYAVLLMGTLPRKPRVVWLMPLVWLLLSVSRIRNSPLFAIAALLALADFWPFTVYARRIAATGGDLYQPPPEGQRRRIGWRPFALPALAVLLALGLQAGGVRVPVIGAGWARLDPNVWPTDLIPAVQELNAAVPDGTPIYNEFTDGAFLIYYAPRMRVYNDDRCELYGDRWQVEQMHLAHDRPAAIEELADRYGFRLAFVRNDTRLAAYLDGRWNVVARGRTATVYRRGE
jgi:hypothetical protein